LRRPRGDGLKWPHLASVVLVLILPDALVVMLRELLSRRRRP